MSFALTPPEGAWVLRTLAESSLGGTVRDLYALSLYEAALAGRYRPPAFRVVADAEALTLSLYDMNPPRLLASFTLDEISATGLRWLYLYERRRTEPKEPAPTGDASPPRQHPPAPQLEGLRVILRSADVAAERAT